MLLYTRDRQLGSLSISIESFCLCFWMVILEILCISSLCSTTHTWICSPFSEVSGNNFYQFGTENIQMRVYLTIFQFPFCSVMWISKFRKNGKETKQKYSQNSGMGGEWIKPNYGSGKGMKKSILKIWEHEKFLSRYQASLFLPPVKKLPIFSEFIKKTQPNL